MQKKLITVLCGLSVLTGCNAPLTDSTNSTAESVEKIVDPLNAPAADMSDYEGMDEVETIGTFHEITWAQLNLILSGNIDGVVYLGYPECKACNKAIEPLNDAAVQSDALIYYMDITSPQIDDVYDEILDGLGDLTHCDDDGKQTFTVPLLIKVESGEITASQSGVPHDIGTDDDDQLTDGGKTNLKNIYNAVINA